MAVFFIFIKNTFIIEEDKFVYENPVSGKQRYK